MIAKRSASLVCSLVPSFLVSMVSVLASTAMVSSLPSPSRSALALATKSRAPVLRIRRAAANISVVVTRVIVAFACRFGEHVPAGRARVAVRDHQRIDEGLEARRLPAVDHD